MGAILETIQSAIIPESGLGPAEPESPQSAESAIENQLSQEITELWSSHVRLSTDHKTTAKEIRQLRLTLSSRLYEMKTLLCDPTRGRASQWRGWLRERGIPRSTADRLVTRHAEMLGIQDESVLSEQVSEANESDVEKKFNSVWAGLKRKLTTPEAAYEFLRRLVERSGLKHEWKDSGVYVFEPIMESPTPGEASLPIAATINAGRENSVGFIQ